MPIRRPKLACLCFLACPAIQPLLGAVDDPFAGLGLDAHGFASFGYLKTWGNDWLADDAREGSSEFWEAAINVSARPLDRLRLGAQLFVRDLGRYDNGQVQLDLLYADWRADDAIGLQAGRVRVPQGLYNEVLDVDAARTPVFLPPAIYALRSRDLFLSIDGAKVYGLVHLDGAGEFEYQFFAGSKELDPELGSAAYFSESGVGSEITEMSYDGIYGGMIRWHTPLAGLTLHVDARNVTGLTIIGATPDYGLRTTYGSDDYFGMTLAAQYETLHWTLAAEYARYHARGSIRIEPSGLVLPFTDNSDAGYVSATWHARRWFELYAAYEVAAPDATDRSKDHSTSAVLAGKLMPLPNWSLKAEFRHNHGTYGLTPVDAPADAEDVWQSLALKTTVDF